MKLGQARHNAEAQQAREAQEAAKGREAGTGGTGQGGYAGGMHKGTAYRHAPRAHPPARRNTGPSPKPRPRPRPATSQGAHPEDEHAQLPQNDPRQMAAGGAGAMSGTTATSGTRGARQQQADPGEQQEAGSMSSPPRVRLPPPLPPVREGAALRRSRLPEAALLASKPPPGGTPIPQLFDALATMCLKAGDGLAQGAMRLAAMAAAARHRPVDAPAPTLAQIKAAAVAWCAANGPPPSATEPQRDTNVLFPLMALRALEPRAEPLQAGADARGALLQRALGDVPLGSESTRRKDPAT